MIRRAALQEADQVAAIARQSRAHFLAFLPNLHSFEEDKDYFRSVVFAQDQVWVVEEDNGIVEFCAFKEGWIDHLYLLPRHVGKTFGAALLTKAKNSFDHLQLWVFQQNGRAISFYERHGFLKVRETDGAECEEKLPDALYEWKRGQG